MGAGGAEGAEGIDGAGGLEVLDESDDDVEADNARNDTSLDPRLDTETGTKRETEDL